jgi:hypothetical protein
MHQNYIELSALKYAAAQELAQRVVGDYNIWLILSLDILFFFGRYLPQP